MISKDWKKTRNYPNDIIYEKGNRWITIRTNWMGEGIVTIKNNNSKYFKNKSQALAFAKSYMSKN